MKTVISQFAAICLLFILPGSICDKSPTNPVYGDGDAYEIYSVILNDFAKDFTPVFVLSDSTVYWDLSDYTHLHDLLPALKPETLNNYNFANRRSKELKAIPDLKITCYLIKQSEVNEWKTRYPDANGLIHFSVVGFDRIREQALVYFSQWVGPLAAYGSLYLVEKNEVWTITQSEMIWIS